MADELATLDAMVQADLVRRGELIGVHLVAACGYEGLLIRVASQLEQAKPWAHRRPTVHA